LVEGFVAEHGVEDVAASSCEADEGGVVFLAFGSFAVVVGAAGGKYSSLKGRGRSRASVVSVFWVCGLILGSAELTGPGTYGRC
jgi:hypothetical protein